MWRRNNHANAEQQLQTLAELKELPAEDITSEQLETIFDTAAHPATNEVQIRAAVLLSQLYPTLAPNDPDFAQRTHCILLRDLRQPRKTLAHPSCSWLVMTHLREENLAHIPWESAEEVASAAECFYGFSGAGLEAQESHRRVGDLVKYAGMRFAEQERWEEVFRLLARVHITSDVMDADLFWLRNTLVLYEQRRVQRMRHILFSLIAGAVLFVLLFAPLLFMGCENPDRLARGMKELGFAEAIYWSVITSASVGYGDIVPQTAHGRIVAVLAGLTGITTMGIIAGLILSYITPRSLP